MDESVAFGNKTKRYARMLKEIMVVTKSLQTNGYTLADCRECLDDLMKAVEEEKRMHSSPFYNCRLGDKYISPTSAIVKYRHFESGVVKIQSGKQHEITTDEEKAVKCLLAGNFVSEENNEIQVNPRSMIERINKRRKVSESNKTKYIDCSFILGSVAAVERLWSIAKYVCTSNRRRMTPLLLESLLFLRENERFCDAQLVSIAVHSARNERVKAQIAAHNEYVENGNNSD